MNIEALAREAADKDKVDPYHNGFWTLTTEELTRFAHLIREALVQELVAVSGEPELSDNGDVFGHEEVRGYTADQLAGAVLRKEHEMMKALELLDKTWRERIKETEEMIGKAVLRERERILNLPQIKGNLFAEKAIRSGT